MGVFLGDTVMDSPFSPHPPLPKNPQLPMPERNVRPKLNLRLMLLLMLIIVITVPPDTTDTDTADTMVDTTALDTADTTDGANREIQCKTLILKERKNNCHQTKLNQKNAAT